MHDLPLAVDLVQEVTLTKGNVDRLAVGSRGGEALNTAGETQIAVGHHVKLDEIDLEVLEAGKPLLQVGMNRLVALDLARRSGHVEQDDLVGRVVILDCLVRSGRVGEFVLQIGYGLFVVVGGVGGAREVPGEEGDCRERANY